MKVTFDENGYVTGWCMVGDNGGEEVDPPENMENFTINFENFRLEDGKLVRDEARETTRQKEAEQNDLRIRREKECFSVINRGWMWYSCLTLSQWRELRTWYLAWLNATSTMSVPERPTWIDNVDSTRIPLTPLGFL